MAPEQIHATIVATASCDVDPRLVAAFPQWFGPNAKDPDEGQGDIECNDLIATISAKFTGLGGTFSTWKERHAFIVGAEIGYSFVDHTVFIPCPEFFQSEAHYFYSGIMAGRLAKKLEDSNTNVTINDMINYGKKISAGLIVGGGAVGAVFGPTIIKYIQTLVGAG